MRANILCSLKTFSGYEKPLKASHFLCHVRAEQQWKGQQWCLVTWRQSWRGSRQQQNLEGSERGLPWHSQAPHSSELVWSPCWTRVKHRTDPKCTKRAGFLREDTEHSMKVNYVINTVGKINSIFILLCHNIRNFFVCAAVLVCKKETSVIRGRLSFSKFLARAGCSITPAYFYVYFPAFAYWTSQGNDLTKIRNAKGNIKPESLKLIRGIIFWC